MTAYQNEIYADISRMFERLNKTKETSAGKICLSRLRKGSGRTMSDSLDAAQAAMGEMPAGCFEDQTQATLDAVFTALTLYALHQQGTSEQVIGQSRENIGEVLAHYTAHEKLEADDKSVLRRLNILMSARSLRDISKYLKNTIGYLKNAGFRFQLDYAALANDLTLFQYPEQRNRVLMKWARSYYKIASQNKASDQAKKSENKTEDKI